MEKIKTGLAAFGMSGQIFHAPFISTSVILQPVLCAVLKSSLLWMSWNWSLSIRQTVRITSIHGKHWRQEKM